MKCAKYFNLYDKIYEHIHQIIYHYINIGYEVCYISDM